MTNSGCADYGGHLYAREPCTVPIFDAIGKTTYRAKTSRGKDVFLKRGARRARVRRVCLRSAEPSLHG